MQENQFVKTLNKMGYMFTGVESFGQAFLEYAIAQKEPCLEIGAAYGALARRILSQKVLLSVNDLDTNHLNSLEESLDPDEKPFLTKYPGRFPDDIDFEPESFGAIYASRILHLVSPEKLLEGVKKMYRWIKPGGKAFMVTDTHYLSFMHKFHPVYEQNKKDKKAWPGLIEDSSLYVDGDRLKDIPKLINFMDLDLFTKVFEEAGFQLVRGAYIPRPDFPEDLRMDGRESAGIELIKKP